MLMRYFVDFRITYQAKQKLLYFNTDHQIDQSQSEYCLRDINKDKKQRGCTKNKVHKTRRIDNDEGGKG